MPKRIRLLMFAGGLIQVLVAFSILFLPVFATCYLNDAPCRRESYIQLGGNVLGYTLLMSMLVLGILVVSIGFRPNNGYQNRILWVAAISSFVIAVIGGWSIGFVFLPGGILLFAAAIFARRLAVENSTLYKEQS